MARRNRRARARPSRRPSSLALPTHQPGALSGSSPGAAGRWLALAGALAGGVVPAIAFIPHFAPWTRTLHFSTATDSESKNPEPRSVVAVLGPVPLGFRLHSGQTCVVVRELVQVRPRDLAGRDLVVVAHMVAGSRRPCSSSTSRPMPSHQCRGFRQIPLAPEISASAGSSKTGQAR
jgi:hypothetical protein